MKQITFDEMLRANGLPPVGTSVTTPRGDKVYVDRYIYDIYEPGVYVITKNSLEIRWTFDQIKLCTWEGKDEAISN